MQRLNTPLRIGKLQVTVADLLSSIIAALGYGAWAVFANFEASQIAALRAGCVQGTYAFCSTLLLSLALRRIFLIVGRGRRGKLCAFIAGIAIIVSLPAILNSIAQTPNVIKTILPGAVIGSIYVGIFSSLLE